MSAETSSTSSAPAFGTAHLAWAVILCAGGIYGLSSAPPPRSDLAESLGAWQLAFTAAGVSAIVGLALLHAWGGQSLRRDGNWPGFLTWGLLATGGILALVAIGILFRGMQSRLLLAGGAPLVAVLAAGGVGTVGLGMITRWLCKEREVDCDPRVEEGRETEQDAAESAALRFALAAIPSLLSAATAAISVFCEASRG